MKRKNKINLTTLSLLSIICLTSPTKNPNLEQISFTETNPIRLETQEHINYSSKKENNQIHEDIELLARALYGEARNKSKELKIAIAQSIINRTNKNKWWGNTLREVILKPEQYSSFNQRDPNYNKVWNPLRYEKPEVWYECLKIAKEVLENKFEDLTEGATHYHTDKVRPLWSRRKNSLTKIDNTLFYKLFK
ncbi:hypothetical protein CL621_00430 [archaeon]|nr:hypothetical protein [archaeon]|tara:strand:- start:4515 stop:5093 length:579 start_codon:yes stop_codon:yes gene_type:complete